MTWVGFSSVAYMSWIVYHVGPSASSKHHCQLFIRQVDERHGLFQTLICNISLIDSHIPFSDRTFSSEHIYSRVHDGELILDQAVLAVAHGSVQLILDCVPSTTKIVVNMDEIPTREGFTISKPLTILSEVGNAKLECPVGSIKIRCVDLVPDGWDPTQ